MIATTTAPWRVDSTKILTMDEIRAVLADAKRRGRRRSSVNTRQNLVIFRLATCAGLRASEIAGLRLAHVVTGIARPHLKLPKAITKGRKARMVPLWWDAGTLADIEAWKAERIAHGATSGDLMVCTQSRAAQGRPLTRQAIRRRFIAVCRVLGRDRQAQLTVHHGRHSFVSHALARGRTLAEVRDAAGHANIGTTSIYAHIAAGADEGVGAMFG